MDAAFRHALHPPRPLVLKLRLAPLTVGHWFILARWCPEFVDAECREPANLPLAALICSLPHRQAARVITRRWLRAFFLFWGWRCRRLDLGAETTRLLDYLRAALQGPDHARHPDRTGGTAHSPTGFWLHGMLMAEFGMDYDRALDLGCAEALCLYAARQESLGKLELVSSRTRQLWEFVRRKRAMTPATENN